MNNQDRNNQDRNVHPPMTFSPAVKAQFILSPVIRKGPFPFPLGPLIPTGKGGPNRGGLSRKRKPMKKRKASKKRKTLSKSKKRNRRM